MKNLSRLLIVFLAAIFLGGCASVEKYSKEQNAAQNQLRAKGVIYNVPSFIQEAANGNLENVKLFVQGGMDINAKSNETALTAACFYNKPEVVKYLVENGANVNVGSYYDDPIIAAVRGGNYDIVKLLIEKGADVNAIGYAHSTPLYVAAEQGKAEISELLIQNGANVHYIQPLTSMTALTATAFVLTGSTAVAEVLVKNGANVNYKTHSGMSVLDWATSRRKFDMAKYLILQGADPNDGEPKGITPRTMLSAIAWSNPDMMKYLVEHGVDVNSKAFGKMPLVIWCAKNLLEEQALTLIDLGAKTDVRFAGSSLLDYAIANREEGLVKKLDPNFDLSRIQGQVVDPNIESQETQIENIMGGTYYKAQHTPTVDNAVKQAVQTNAEVSEAANQAVGSGKAQDDVTAKGAGNTQEATAVSEALKEQGRQQEESFEYPVDQVKLEKEIDQEIKKIESKYSNGQSGQDSLTQNEDDWYQPVKTTAPTETLYDSPVEAPNQTKAPAAKASTKPYQYKSPSTRNAELAPEAADVVSGRAFDETPTEVQPISTGETNLDSASSQHQVKTPGNVDQNAQLAKPDQKINTGETTEVTSSQPQKAEGKNGIDLDDLYAKPDPTSK